MIPKRNFFSFLLILLFLGLVGCGGGGDGTVTADNAPPGDGGGDTGGGGTDEPPPVADVELEGLDGTWFGTFDDTSSVRSYEFTVAAGAMSDFKLNGDTTGLTTLSGTITKATEVPRAFRFVLNSNGGEVTRGIMLLDPSGTYMTYVDAEKDFAVLQKGATEHPTYAQTDIDKSWAGDTVTATADFSTLTQTTTTATCAPTDPATDPVSSQCNITIGDATQRTATNVALDNALGRWLGAFTDDPPPSTPPTAFVATRPYLSPDKNFAAVWACHDFRGASFGPACDFSTWTAQ